MGFKKYLVGEVRPSQLLLTYGVGSIIDLPHMATLVMGLNDWDTTRAKEIIEERLLSTIQTVLGPQVTQLLSPPASDTAAQTPFSPDLDPLSRSQGREMRIASLSVSSFAINQPLDICSAFETSTAHQATYL